MKEVDTESREQANILKRVLEALLYSSVFISCCAFFLTIETYLLAGLEVNLPMAVFVFLATLFTYNLSSVQSIVRRPRQQINPEHPAWGLRYKRQLALLGCGSIAAAAFVYVVYGLKLNIWFVLHLAVISVGYTVPIVYKRERIRPLRSLPLLKVFLIAYVWAAVTSLFPLLDAGIAIGVEEAGLLFLRRFLFILALALLFDIRDYTYDRNTNTLTFPGLFGTRNTKLLALALLITYVVLATATEAGRVQVALIISGVIAALVVMFSSENRSRIYYSLLADGAMLLHAALVYLACS